MKRLRLALASWLLGGADKELLRLAQTDPRRIVDLNTLLATNDVARQRRLLDSLRTMVETQDAGLDTLRKLVETDDPSRRERLLRILDFAIEDLDRIEWAYELCRPSTGVMPDSGRPDRYVDGVGWVKSRQTSRPVDADGKPLPWIAYPAIEFLTPRIKTGWRVFEYGCGYSTLWWEQLGCSIVACEHDRAWAEEVRGMTKSANIVVRDLTDGYALEVLNHGLFDVVVIDGRQRVACSEVAPQVLGPAGVIIWDNADRMEYREGQEKLKAAGWKAIEFVGMSSGNLYGATTTIFYRSENCLCI